FKTCPRKAVGMAPKIRRSTQDALVRQTSIGSLRAASAAAGRATRYNKESGRSIRAGPRGKKEWALLTRGNAMTDRLEPLDRPRTSRERYRTFVHDYQRRQLDEAAEKAKEKKPPAEPTAEPQPARRGKR